MSVSAQSAARDFCADTRRALASAGVTLLGARTLQTDGIFGGPQRGYVLDDNGHKRVVVRDEVLQIVNRKCAQKGS